MKLYRSRQIAQVLALCVETVRCTHIRWMPKLLWGVAIPSNQTLFPIKKIPPLFFLLLDLLVPELGTLLRSTLFCNWGALLFLPDFQTYFPPSALSTTPATALAAFLSESILRCDCRKSPHRGGQCQEGSKCNHHCPRMGQKLAWIKIADKK